MALDSLHIGNNLVNQTQSLATSQENAFDYLMLGLDRAAGIQKKATEKALIVKEGQEHLKHLAGIIQSINLSIDDANGLDLSKNEALSKALKKAKEDQLIELNLNKDFYTPRERDHLLSDLNTAMGLIKDKNQMEFHEIQVYSRHHDQFLQILGSISKQISNMKITPAKRIGN